MPRQGFIIIDNWRILFSFLPSFSQRSIKANLIQTALLLVDLFSNGYVHVLHTVFVFNSETHTTSRWKFGKTNTARWQSFIKFFRWYERLSRIYRWTVTYCTAAVVRWKSYKKYNAEMFVGITWLSVIKRVTTKLDFQPRHAGHRTWGTFATIQWRCCCRRRCCAVGPTTEITCYLCVGHVIEWLIHDAIVPTYKSLFEGTKKKKRREKTPKYVAISFICHPALNCFRWMAQVQRMRLFN